MIDIDHHKNLPFAKSLKCLSEMKIQKLISHQSISACVVLSIIDNLNSFTFIHWAISFSAFKILFFFAFDSFSDQSLYCRSVDVLKI